MPPKKNKINNEKYTLIWWIVSGEKTITESTKIPKAKRKKNTTVNLLWEGKNKKKEFFYAKIIEFGATMDELEKIRLDNKGNICDDSTKLYTEDVLEQKKQLEIAKKIAKKFEEKNNNILEKNITHLKPLFPIDEPPLSGNKEDKINKFKSKIEKKDLAKKNNESDHQVNLREHNTENTVIRPNITETIYVSGQHDAEQDGSISVNDSQLTTPPDLSNLHPIGNGIEKSTDTLVDSASIWNDNYLNNWMSVNNPARVTQSSLIEKCGYPTAFLSSDVLELGSIPTKVLDTPTMECSSNYTQNKTASIFRPWDSLNAVGTTTTSTTVEEEIFLESTEPTNIHIPADLLKDTEITEEPLNIGALHTFLKSEVRECDLQFVRVLEKSVIQAYESYKRYNRQSTATLEMPEFYTRPGEHIVEITPDSKIYFPKNIKQQIEEMSEGDNGCDWETIVRLSLKQVYDDNVGNYSAKGKATGSNTIAHPPIDTRLYNGIYKWVNQKVGNSKIITEKMFNKVINKFCLNKREIGSKENFDQSDMITDENLQFFRKIVKVIEESYDIQQREMLPERQTHQLSNLFTQPAKNKIKISPLYEIYLPKSTYTYVERSSETERGKYDWRILVKEALLEIYGDSLKNYSAKGRRGGSPGINTELYRALYDWASSLVNVEQITDADFVDVINKLTTNQKN